MTWLGRLGAVVGATCFALGLGIVLAPDIARLLSVDGLVAAWGQDYLLAAAVGVVAVALALVVVGLRTVHGYDQATPPPAESIPTGRPPGAEFDRVVADDLGPLDHLRGRERAAVRRRLRRAAVATLARTAGCPRSTAETTVAAGEWTADPTAAAFLADDAVSDPTWRRVVDALPGRSRFARRARRAAVAIVALEPEEASS